MLKNYKAERVTKVFIILLAVVLLGQAKKIAKNKTQ